VAHVLVRLRVWLHFEGKENRHLLRKLRRFGIVDQQAVRCETGVRVAA
jgi:hypothetical protein